MPTLAQNRKARFHYQIEDQFEAGLALLGHEVKSLRLGQASLDGAFVTIRNREAFLRNAYIGKYKHASQLDGYDEQRERKLLLHKSELEKLANTIRQKGLTLVPLEIYTKKNRLKLKIGLGRGKKRFDKRETIKQKETKRQLARAVRSRI